jgi:hypothetical protein
MLSQLGILVLLIFTLSVFLLYYRFHQSNLRNFQTKITKYEDIQAGDIFLVSFESVSKMFSDSLFNIQFLHPTLVVEQNNEKYVVELMNYSNTRGFHMMELDEWINRQKHNSILLNKMTIKNNYFESKEMSEDQIRKEISKRIISFTQPYSGGESKIRTVGGFDGTWWRYVNPKGRYSGQQIENGVTPCNEFCVYLLIKSGVVDNDKHIDHFHPDTFIGMNGFKVKKPFNFDEHYLCDLSQYASE